MSDFDKDYFENRSSYGMAGGYEAMLRSTQRFYSEYFRLASRKIPQFTQADGRTAIEVGCAYGVGSSLLARCGWAVTATDISEYACEQAKKNVPAGVVVRRLDIMSDSGLGQYDLVAAIQVVEHVAGPRFVERLSSLVAPRGWLLIATPNPRSCSPYRKFQKDPTHINEQPPEYWVRAVAGSGMKVRSVQTLHVIPFLSRFVVRFVTVPSWVGYDTLIIAQRE